MSIEITRLENGLTVASDRMAAVETVKPFSSRPIWPIFMSGKNTSASCPTISVRCANLSAPTRATPRG